MRQPKLTRKEEPLTENKEYLMSKDTIFQADPAVRLSNQSLCGKALYRIEKKTDKNRMQVSILNCSDRDLKIKEVVLYGGTLPVSKDTPFYGEGFHMLSQYRGTLEHPVTVGAYGDDETFFRFPGEPYRQGMTRVSNLMLLMPEHTALRAVLSVGCDRGTGRLLLTVESVEAGGYGLPSGLSSLLSDQLSDAANQALSERGVQFSGIRISEDQIAFTL